MGPAAMGLTPTNSALFLDLDGTLIDIAPGPDQVSVAPGLPGLLQALDHRLDGALVIVTGRPVSFVDGLLPGHGLTLVGLHGSQFRAGLRAAAQIPPLIFNLPEIDLAALDRARGAARQQAAPLPGVVFEEKGEAFALHYRQAPDQAGAVQAIMAGAAGIAGAGFALRPGKCVIELCPAGCDKGQALKTLMRQTPFAGRRPIAVGDDLTDEAMFAAIPPMGGPSGGLSIGIGDRPSHADMTLTSPADLHLWLKGFLE